MPRFFFNSQDGDAFKDADGVELPHVRAAQYEASKLLGEIISDEPQDVWHPNGFQLTVTDADDLVLFVLNASVTLSPALSQGPAEAVTATVGR